MIPNPAFARTPRIALALAAAGLLAAGCANVERARTLSELPVEATSPAAQQILEASRRPGRYPTFQEIPPAPSDVRPAEGWRQAVTGIRGANNELAAEVAASPPTLHDSEAWAASQAAAAAPPPPPEGPSTEEFAEALRERVKPPPKPN